MIKVLIDGVINNKPKLVQNQGITATVFSLKSGKEIVTVATEPNAINELKKGHNLTVHGIFEITNAIVGATQIINHSLKTKNERNIPPLKSLPQQTKRKPNRKDGTFDIPKSARVISQTETVEIPSQKEIQVPQVEKPIEKKEEFSSTVKIPNLQNIKPEIPSKKEDKVKTMVDEDGLPLPSFDTFESSVPKQPSVEKTEKPVVKNDSKKKTRWNNDDFIM